MSCLQWATYIMHTNALQSKAHVGAKMMLNGVHTVDKLNPQFNSEDDGKHQNNLSIKEAVSRDVLRSKSKPS